MTAAHELRLEEIGEETCQRNTLPVWYKDRIGLSWMTLDEVDYLLTKITEEIDMVLEVGSASGVTISKLAEKKNHCHFMSIDPFTACPPDDLDRRDFEETEDSVRILKWLENKQTNQNLFVGTLREFRRTTTNMRVYDIIIIDGDHSYECVKEDLIQATYLLRSDGLLICHDYNDPNWTGVSRAVDEFVSEWKMFSCVNPVGSLAVLEMV